MYFCRLKLNRYDYEESIIDSSNGGCGDAGNGTTDEVVRQRNQ